MKKIGHLKSDKIDENSCLIQPMKRRKRNKGPEPKFLEIMQGEGGGPILYLEQVLVPS